MAADPETLQRLKQGIVEAVRAYIPPRRTTAADDQRRAAGLKRVTVWIPVESEAEFRDRAREACEQQQRGPDDLFGRRGQRVP